MTKSIILAAFFSLTSLISFSQNEKPFRDEFTLKLPVDGEQFYEQKVLKSPFFVKDNVLQIYPGESLFIEVEKTKNEITSMKVVKVNVQPEKTLIVELTQTVKERKSESMILKVINPFDSDLNYKVLMYIVGQSKWIPTDVFPVKAKLTGYETWSDIIITMVLSDWKFKK